MMARFRGVLALGLVAVLTFPRDGWSEPLPPPEGCAVPIEGACRPADEVELSDLALQFIGACPPLGVGELTVEDEQQCCYAIEVNCDAQPIEEEEARGCKG